MSRPKTDQGNDIGRLGRQGERLAHKYLKKGGLRLVKSNYTIKPGEIDLIMTDGQSLVFVEVKTRRDEDENVSDVENVVNYHKKQKIRTVARHFIHVNGLQDRPCRFDVVIVIAPREGQATVRHYQNAFSI